MAGRTPFIQEAGLSGLPSAFALVAARCFHVAHCSAHLPYPTSFLTVPHKPSISAGLSHADKAWATTSVLSDDSTLPLASRQPSTCPCHFRDQTTDATGSVQTNFPTPLSRKTKTKTKKQNKTLKVLALMITSVNQY